MAPVSDRFDNMSRYESTSASSYSPLEHQHSFQNGNSNGHGAVGDGMFSLEAKLDQFRKSDNERDALVKDLIDRYKQLQDQYQEKSYDYDNERRSRIDLQRCNRELEQSMRLMKQSTEPNPFCLAIIDGDGAVFHDHLLQGVINGGLEAGHLLNTEIRQLLHRRHEGSGSWSIMVQIYANFEGLARKLHSLNIIRSPGEFAAFAKAFNLSQGLFNLIDVGSGKERADHKIKETFKLFVDNAQCKHIIFGGCHDNGYLPNIGQYQYDVLKSQKMTLLETTPAERGFLNLGISVATFDSVFRNTQLDAPLRSAVAPPPATMHFRSQPVTVNEFVSSSSMTSIPTGYENQPPALSQPLPAMAAKLPTPQPQAAAPPAAAPAKAPSPVPASAKTAPTTTASSGSSYASYASYAKISNTLPIDTDGFSGISRASKRPVVPDPKLVLINAADQRIDPKFPKVDSNTVQELNNRIKQSKVCNNWHIFGTCPMNKKCPFDHGERMSSKEQLALRYKARERLCPRKAGCRDPNCLCGHHCPWDGDCNRGTCYFGDLHDMDLVVKMRMHDDGKLELVN